MRQQAGATDVHNVPVKSSSRTSTQTSLNQPPSAMDVGQAETQSDITLTSALSRPFTSLKRNWFRAPMLPSDWLEYFVAVWGVGRFTTAFVDSWRPQ